MQGLTLRSMSSPPDRNTVEWLKAYVTNPRLAPVRKIATDLSSVPGKLYRGVGKKKKQLDKHPFLDFWERPNPLPELTPAALWKLMEVWYQLKGEAICVIERGHKRQPAELWPVPPHWIAETPHKGSPYYVIQNSEGKRVNVPRADVFVYKDLSPFDPYGRGIGQAEAVADEVESYEYATKFSKTVFFNNARPDYIICAPGITDEQITRFLASIDRRHRGPWNAHRPGIIPRGDVTFQRMSDSPREMDFVASRKDLRDTVNSHWGVPPELLGIVENSNRATAEAAKAIYAENVLTPLLLIRQAAINSQLLPQFEDGILWEFDDIIPADELYQLQVANEGLSRCAIMINEWREKMGFDPLPNGNAFVVPVSSIIVPADELLTSAAVPIAENNAMPELITQPPDALNDEAQTVQTAKEVSLNGAQIASLVQIVQSVNAGELSEDSAIEIITSAFPFDVAKARSIIGQRINPQTPAGKSATPGTGKKSRRKAPARAQVRQMMDAARLAQERSAKQIVQRSLQHQHGEIMKALGTGKKSADDAWADLLSIDLTGDVRGIIDRVDDILGQTIDWPAQDRAIQSALRPVWHSAYDAGAKLAADTYQIGIQQPALSRQALASGASRIKGINETTRAALAKSIADGISAGDGRQQLIDRVQQAMPGVSSGRAGVIAANEVHTSLMSGNFDTLKAAGYQTKTWLTAGDSDVRGSHQRLNGKTVGINEKFPNGLMYPGDPSGPPSEIIGCRCDLIAGEPIEDSQTGDRPVQMSPVNFFNSRAVDRDESNIYEFSQLVEPEDGFEDVFIHSDAARFFITNKYGEQTAFHPMEIAEILRKSENYKGGNIRLCSCEAGSDPNGAAQQLADALGVDVKAPNRLLFLDNRGNITIADDVEDVGTYGDWVIYKPRR